MESHEINKYFKKIVRYGGGADAKKTETDLCLPRLSEAE